LLINFLFLFRLLRNCGSDAREIGSDEALPHSGGRERALKDEKELIRRKVAAQPDITLLELVEYVSRETGKEAVSKQTINVELQRLKLPRKKVASRFRERNRAGFEDAR
jgi:transposase